MYWAPSLYIYNPNDMKYHIVPTFTRAYYRIRYNNNDDPSDEIQPFPPFLRMIAGTASRAVYWNDGHEHDNIRWTNRTWNRRTTNSIEHGDWEYFLASTEQEIDAMEQLEMNVNFPECVQVEADGVTPRTSSNDWRSHVSYRMDDSRCPQDFPYHMPSLVLEVRYKLDETRDSLGDDAYVVNQVANWRLSSGDTSGAGAHADFISGWPMDLMRDAM